MIDPAHELSLTRQAATLGISRGSIYYFPKPPSQRDLGLMNCIDRLYLELPFAGARMLHDLLNDLPWPRLAFITRPGTGC